MHTALIALMSALSVAGVGTTAVAMTGNGMMNGNHGMMGTAGMGPGMNNADHNAMHGGMMGGHMDHDDCPCCGGDNGNDTGNQAQNQLSP